MRRSLHAILAGLAGLSIAFAAAPARADVTVIGRYTLANGDTVTRASYFTSKQIRTTLPDGMEIIYNHEGKRMALVDHKNRRYWEGRSSLADSIATRIRTERNQALQANVTPEEREKWSAIYAALGDSVKMVATGRSRTLCGYPVSEYVLTAGPYLRQEKWVARSLALPNFSSEVEKVVLATITDPVGRGVMKLILQGRELDGMSLATDIRFETLAQKGTFGFEALQVESNKLSPVVWMVPTDYSRWEIPVGGAKK